MKTFLTSKNLPMLALLLLLLNSVSGDEVCDQREFYGRDIRETCIDVQGKSRCYFSYVPDVCDELNISKAPLLVDSHGRGGWAGQQLSTSGWMKLAETECIVVMWPKGDCDALSTPGACWSVPAFLRTDYSDIETSGGFCDKDNDPSSTPDEVGDTLTLKVFIDSLVETLLDGTYQGTSMTIDTDRVYMSGHSNGCFISTAMAALHSDIVAGVACFGGGLRTPFASTYTPVPVWMVHGSKDIVLPYNGLDFDLDENNPAYLTGFPKSYTLLPKSAEFAYIAERNSCTDEKNTVDIYGDDGAVIGNLTKHTNCKQNAAVELLTLFEMGHLTYPLSAAATEELVPAIEQNLEATKEIFLNTFGYEYGELPTLDTTGMAWEFLRVHSKSGSVKEGAEGAVESSSPFPMVWTGLILAASTVFVVAW